MKRVSLLLLFVVSVGVAGWSVAQPDDYVDDAYFWQPKKRKVIQTQTDGKQPAVVQDTLSLPVRSSSGTGGGKKAEVRFVQVSDTVVKAVIRR